MKNLKSNELIDLSGGHCPPKPDQGISYNIGYLVGTIFSYANEISSFFD